MRLFFYCLILKLVKMSTKKQKTPQEALDALKRSNKEARKKSAIKNGFNTYEEYVAYLEGLISKGNVKVTITKKQKPSVIKTIKKFISPKTDDKPTIHLIDVLDSSGSMGRYSDKGSKFFNAVNGIRESAAECLKDQFVNYSYSLCLFSAHTQIKFINKTVPLEQANFDIKSFENMTALNDAIMESLKLAKTLPKQDKVLVNIYTDGGENDSRKYSKSQVAFVIEELKSKNVVVTFIGTPQDTTNAIHHYKIDESNTLTYNGSAEGMAKSMKTNSLARTAFSKRVVNNENVATGFYKNIK